MGRRDCVGTWLCWWGRERREMRETIDDSSCDRNGVGEQVETAASNESVLYGAIRYSRCGGPWIWFPIKRCGFTRLRNEADGRW